MLRKAVPSQLSSISMCLGGLLCLAVQLCTGVAVSSAGSQAQPGFERAERPWIWRFPRDHGSHPEFQTEWWYFTGSVEDASSSTYGFELTFFRFALRPVRPPDASAWRTRDLILAHFTITDIDAGRFHLAEKLQRGAAGLAGAKRERFEVWLNDWRAWQQDGVFHLDAGDDQNGVQLQLVPERDPVLHGENGLSWKSADRRHASYYYSIPRLRTTGTMRLGSRTLTVEGTTWMDHEFFTGDTPVQGVGWDWFSCRLDDGRDLMLYLLRYPDGSRFRSGTLVDRDGSSRPLNVEGMRLDPLRTWTSPHTGATYPVAWKIELPQERLQLRVEARVDAQEVHAEQTVGFAYWEGLCRYSGRFDDQEVRGEGYVELTGYAAAEP
jgi:predicted secreted hydrolase